MPIRTAPLRLPQQPASGSDPSPPARRRSRIREGRKIHQERGRAGRRAVSIPPLRSARAGGAVGRAPVRAQEGAELPEVPGAPAAPSGSQLLPASPSGPDPRLGAGGTRRREKPPLLLVRPSLTGPALPGWAHRSWRCGCWRRRGSCAVSERRPRGQRREPRRGGGLGRGRQPRLLPARRLSGPFCPLPASPLRRGSPRPGPHWGLASTGTCWEGTEETDGGDGGANSVKGLKWWLPQGRGCGFLWGSSRLENREEGSPSGVGQGGFTSRAPVPTLSHISLHSKTAPLLGLLCSIHVDLLLLSAERRQNKHPPRIWSVKRTEIPEN